MIGVALAVRFRDSLAFPHVALVGLAALASSLVVRERHRAARALQHAERQAETKRIEEPHLEREKRLEEALATAEERVQLAVKAAGLGYWHWDASLDEVEQDEISDELFGGTHGRFKPLYAVLAAIHRDDREPVRKALHAALHHGRGFAMEFRVVHASGEVHWIAAKGDVVRNAEGKPVGMIGVNLAISEQKRAETALRDSESQLRDLVDDAPVILWLARPDGSSVYLTARWYEYTGQTAEESLGLGWLEAIHPDDRERLRATYLEANRQGTTYRSEYRLRRYDGTYRWFLDTGTPRIADGEPLGFIGSV
ncbi:MAG: PAS domain-containing protein, partial [Polyangiaceae bacterium]|nr:PAS domain-containing protein [Polyangiaceae bacterium]